MTVDAGLLLRALLVIIILVGGIVTGEWRETFRAALAGIPHMCATRRYPWMRTATPAELTR